MKDRQEEITENYLKFVQNHVSEVVSGKKQDFMKLNEIASELAVSHKHLIDILKQTRGNHPCHFYDAEIIRQSKEMLIQTELPIAEIARKMTYDPSNFSKFFKKCPKNSLNHQNEKIPLELRFKNLSLYDETFQNEPIYPAVIFPKTAPNF